MEVVANGSNISTRLWNNEQLGAIRVNVAAFDGEVGVGHIPIWDPDNNDNLGTGQSLEILQDHTRLVDGFNHRTDRERGPNPRTPLPTTGPVEWLHDLEDANATLAHIRTTAAGWVRPAETDRARVLAAAAEFRPDLNTTWVLSTDTIDLPKKTYQTGDIFGDVMKDAVGYTGKTWFVHDIAQGSNTRHLHYHGLTEGHTATLAISDDPAAVDGVNTFAPINPRRQTDPTDLRNSVVFRDQAGRTYTVVDHDSITVHDVDGRKHQSYEVVEAASRADLISQAERYLRDHRLDTLSHYCTIGPLDGTALAKFRVGDLISVDSEVMVLTPANMKRIAHIEYYLAQDNAGRFSPDLWYADLEIGYPRRGRRTPRPAPEAPFKPDQGFPACGSTFWPYEGSYVVSSPDFSDHLAPLWDCFFGGTDYRFEITLSMAPTVYPGKWGLSSTGRDVGGIQFYVDDVPVGTTSLSGTFNTGVLGSPFSVRFWTEVNLHPNAIGTQLTVTYRIWPAGYPDFSQVAPPDPGQAVSGELVWTGDGVTTTGTTNFGYQPGSLEVYVGGIRIIAEETDPENGEFTLAFAPAPGVPVVAIYVASDAGHTGSNNLPPPPAEPVIPDGLVESVETLALDLTNRSGALRSPGDVVIIDTANDDSFTISSSASNTKVPVGIVDESIAAGSNGRVVFGGLAENVSVGSNVQATRGQYLYHSSTATKADPMGGPAIGGAFGYVTSQGSNRAPQALIFDTIQGWPAIGSNSTHVREVSSSGTTGLNQWSPYDHAHAGVAQITSSASNTLQRGTVNFRAGTNVALTSTDTDGDGELDTITIHSSASGGGGGGSATLDGRALLCPITGHGSFGSTATGAFTNDAASLWQVVVPAPMLLSGLNMLISAAGSGTVQWGLFDCSVDPTACTKLAGGTGSLNGTGIRELAATGAPVSIDPGTYMIVFLAASANNATHRRTDNVTGITLPFQKSQASYTWTDTPNIETGWTMNTVITMAWLRGYTDAGTVFPS